MNQDIGILIVDDEQIVRDSLAGWFIEDGYRVDTASSGQEALEKLQSGTWHIFLVDIKMPGMDGLELQQRVKEIDENIVVIIMTAYASVETAVQALKEGAYDYITKPFDPDDLAHIIRNAIERRRLIWENAQLRESLEDRAGFKQIIGKSRQILHVLEQVAQVAQTDATVLLLGESGTGKELIAQAIHQQSRRRYMPMVAVNCGAMTEGLLESDLFGHERGAFTGAQYRKKGKFELADGGTIFFDEIGDISPKTQADLLRVLETKEFVRVGGQKPLKSDFRVISATNRDLHALIREGAFRLDLYYRLNAFTITVPPLRERTEDIPLLAEHFRTTLGEQLHKPVERIADEAIPKLMGYPWPGNVRELRHVIEHAIVVARGTTITAKDIVLPGEEPGAGPSTSRDAGLPNGGVGSLADAERRHIESVLVETDWNITKAAKVLDIDRVTLYNKIKRYGIQRPS